MLHDCLRRTRVLVEKTVSYISQAQAVCSVVEAACVCIIFSDSLSLSLSLSLALSLSLVLGIEVFNCCCPT